MAHFDLIEVLFLNFLESNTDFYSYHINLMRDRFTPFDIRGNILDFLSKSKVSYKVFFLYRLYLSKV